MVQSNRSASPWVERFAHRIREGGTVLDLACGSGRHSAYLRTLGYRVVAADLDVSGLGALQDDEGIEIIETDLEAAQWPFGEQRFDGIVVTNYLHRSHLPLLPDALAPEGVLIFETFAKGNEKHGRPSNPRFLLEPGELLDAFARKLEVVAYEHGFESCPKPAVRQRICAVKSAV